MTNELISIIIPVYNVNSYLEQCVKSVLSQTYKKFELILVDDGSTDGSEDLCDALSLTDPRIRVFHKVNNGVGVARNYGLDQAEGKYVVFVDSDDWIAPNLLEECLSALVDTDSDIVLYKYNAIDEKGLPYSFSGNLNAFHSTKPLVTDSVLKFFFCGQLEAYVWSFMAKRCLYDSGEKIRFSKEKVFEDFNLMYKLFTKAERVLILEKKLYNYRQRKRSLIHSGSGYEFSVLYSNVHMDEFNYFMQMSNRCKLSSTTFDVMILRCLEAQVASYYDILRQCIHGEKDSMLVTVRNRIYTILRETKGRHFKMPYGMSLRIYAIKYHLDYFLAETENLFRR